MQDNLKSLLVAMSVYRIDGLHKMEQHLETKIKAIIIGKIMKIPFFENTLH